MSSAVFQLTICIEKSVAIEEKLFVLGDFLGKSTDFLA